jgi:hypothetical protein
MSDEATQPESNPDGASPDEAIEAPPTEKESPLWLWIMVLFGTIATLAGAFWYLFMKAVPQSVVVKGRPLRRGGSIALADPVETVDGEAAAVWLDDARAEHSSAAAFQRLALELMALGAPLDLVKDCQSAAADELRHTELCLNEARKLAGQEKLPAIGGLPAATQSFGWRPRIWRLNELALDAIFDGALGEGVAAELAAQAAEKLEEGERKESLRSIAADEKRHAELNLRIAEFCLESGGEPLRRSLRYALSALKKSRLQPRSLSLSEEELVDSGLWSGEQEREIWNTRRAALVEGLGKRLAA